MVRRSAAGMPFAPVRFGEPLPQQRLPDIALRRFDPRQRSPETVVAVAADDHRLAIEQRDQASACQYRPAAFVRVGRVQLRRVDLQQPDLLPIDPHRIAIVDAGFAPRWRRWADGDRKGGG